jgi:hypothetical protein
MKTQKGSRCRPIPLLFLWLRQKADGGWLTPSPDRFIPGMTRYPWHRRLCGPQGQSGGMQNITPPPEFDPRTVKSINSCCHCIVKGSKYWYAMTKINQWVYWDVLVKSQNLSHVAAEPNFGPHSFTICKEKNLNKKHKDGNT